jgi:hypothetical protein
MDMQEREITAKTKTITEILEKNSYDIGFEVYYNSYGHLVLRWFVMSSEERDFIITLNPKETQKVIDLAKVFPLSSG